MSTLSSSGHRWRFSWCFTVLTFLHWARAEKKIYIILNGYIWTSICIDFSLHIQLKGVLDSPFFRLAPLALRHSAKERERERERESYFGAVLEPPREPLIIFTAAITGLFFAVFLPSALHCRSFLCRCISLIVRPINQSDSRRFDPSKKRERDPIVLVCPPLPPPPPRAELLL